MNNETLLREYKFATADRRTEIENIIIENNLGLVGKYVHCNNLKELNEDVFQEGVVGLLIAIRKFDPDKGFNYSTYALSWVKQRIVRHYKKDSFFIRVPEWNFRNYRKETSQRATNFVKNLDNEWSEVTDFIGQEVEHEERLDFQSVLNNFLPTLSERDRGIFKSRFIDYNTLAETGKMYNITRERVRQVEDQIRTRLAKFIKIKKLNYLIENRQFIS